MKLVQETRPPGGSRRVAHEGGGDSRRIDEGVLGARRGDPTQKPPAPVTTRRDVASVAARFVAACRRWTPSPSSPRLASHPHSQASRQRSSGGRVSVSRKATKAVAGVVPALRRGRPTELFAAPPRPEPAEGKLGKILRCSQLLVRKPGNPFDTERRGGCRWA